MAASRCFTPSAAFHAKIIWLENSYSSQRYNSTLSSFFPVGVLLRRWPENQSHDSFKGGYSVIYLTWSLRICLESRSWLPISSSYSLSTVLDLIFSIGFLCFFMDKYPTPTLPPHSCIDFILWLEEGLLDQFNWRERKFQRNTSILWSLGRLYWSRLWFYKGFLFCPFLQISNGRIIIEQIKSHSQRSQWWSDSFIEPNPCFAQPGHQNQGRGAACGQ